MLEAYDPRWETWSALALEDSIDRVVIMETWWNGEYQLGMIIYILTL